MGGSVAPTRMSYIEANSISCTTQCGLLDINWQNILIFYMSGFSPDCGQASDVDTGKTHHNGQSLLFFTKCLLKHAISEHGLEGSPKLKLSFSDQGGVKYYKIISTLLIRIQRSQCYYTISIGNWKVCFFWHRHVWTSCLYLESCTHFSNIEMLGVMT